MRFLWFLIPFLSGCAGLNTQLPEISEAQHQTEKAAQEKAVFEEMDRLRLRLDRVGHRVLSANADLCERTGPDVGIVTYTIDSFPKEIREGAVSAMNLSDVPTVAYVRPGSLAEQLDIQLGDQIQDEDGAPLSVPGKRLNTLISEKKNLKRVRGETSIDLNFSEVEEACFYPLRLKMSPAINAFANGRSIIVTAGMLNFVKSDDELAYIIGHELAHNTHDHIRKSIFNYMISLGGTRYTRPFEAEADYVGIYYMTRAGFDSSDLEEFWRRLALQSMRPIGRAKTHPTYPDRAVLLKESRKEIFEKQKNGEPVLPERRSDK